MGAGKEKKKMAMAMSVLPVVMNVKAEGLLLRTAGATLETMEGSLVEAMMTAASGIAVEGAGAWKVGASSTVMVATGSKPLVEMLVVGATEGRGFKVAHGNLSMIV